VSLIQDPATATAANVAPAGNAATTGEAALVVALSPNSPIPAGTNSIGSVEVGGLGAAGAALVGNPVQMGGSDGTDTRTILTDISGRQIVNQGVASNLAGAWTMQITDTTNGPVAVKPASTASTKTDAALVVALSPNSNTIQGTSADGVATTANPIIVGGVDLNNLAQQVSVVTQNGITALNVSEPVLQNKLDMIIVILMDIRNSLANNQDKPNQNDAT
jgi:hypothetical protein